MNMGFGRMGKTLLAGLMMVAALISGRSFADPMYLMIKPLEEKAGKATESKNIKVCLVVEDNRDPNVVKYQMCGLAMWRGKIAVLRNQETLQTLLAHDLADRLTYAGYDVVKTYPSVPEHLSSEHREPMKGIVKKELKAAYKSQNRKSQNEARARHKKRKADGPDPIVFREATGAVKAKGGEGWTNGADVVLEVSITDFTGYFIDHVWTIGSLGTSSLSLAITGGEGKSSNSIRVAETGASGHIEARPMVQALIKAVLNKNYRHLVESMETLFLSDDFERVARAAK